MNCGSCSQKTFHKCEEADQGRKNPVVSVVSSIVIYGHYMYFLMCFCFFAIQIREYEEYLNRRHAVCNSKEEDLGILQNVSELLLW